MTEDANVHVVQTVGLKEERRRPSTSAVFTSQAMKDVMVTISTFNVQSIVNTYI